MEHAETRPVSSILKFLFNNPRVLVRTSSELGNELLQFLTRVSAFLWAVLSLTRVNFHTNLNYLFQGKRLLEDRKLDFNKQLDHLAEPIGAMLQKTSEEYAGMQIV